MIAEDNSKSSTRIIRKATPTDLEDILSILVSVGNSTKKPQQGFLMDDYTQNQEQHRKSYREELDTTNHTYVCQENEQVIAFMKAYTRCEWLQKVPGWEEVVYWKPGFDKDCLVNYALISQTAMFPGLTGKGIGSALFDFLLQELLQEDIGHIFAETLIAPVPNLASLNYRLKLKYNYAGMRYEEIQGQVFTTLVYHKETKKKKTRA